jgi:hypothetical protein
MTGVAYLPFYSTNQRLTLLKKKWQSKKEKERRKIAHVQQILIGLELIE